MTADRIVRCAQVVTIEPATAYTLSFYIKNISSIATNSFYLRNVENDSDSFFTSDSFLHLQINWAGAVPTPSIYTNAGGGGALVTTEALANDWYRIGATVTSPAVLKSITQVALNTGQAVALWGVELKAESTRTSYVPSLPEQGTRAAEEGGPIAATATGYERASGSFLADGFAIGMQVTPDGFTESTPARIVAVDALAITTDLPRAVDAPAGGRSLTVGLPDVAYENVRYTPTPGRVWFREEYLPGGGSNLTLGAFATLTQLPLYVIHAHLPQFQDATAASRYTDALLNHFAPTTPLSVPGATVTVRSDVVPSPSPLQPTGDGWAVVTMSIPLRVTTSNSR
jgi:hypothetical protein